MTIIARRHALQLLGAMAVGCGGAEKEDDVPQASNRQAGDGDPPRAVEGVTAETNPGPAAPAPTDRELLAGIDTIVVVMMENRSFDHYLGSLRGDAAYAARASIDGLTGAESNPDPTGRPVPVFRLENFTPADPPHEWEACLAQFNGGKNDGFVREHAGPSQREVMGFHDRSQLPFYYWLADHYAVCDRWFSSVMGPTWPNRFYLHAGTSAGKRENRSQASPIDTLWDRMRAAGKTFKNYYAGAAAWFVGACPTKLLTLNPTAPIRQFFEDAERGSLPNFSVIDPDFLVNDDHPNHNLKLGQIFVHSIYEAMAKSPQWSRSLLVVTYDEHGGFFDHVPPPVAPDTDDAFRRFGFRVPTFVVGPTVKRGQVVSVDLDHTSVGATAALRFGFEPLGERMRHAKTLAACLDPERIRAPRAAADGAPKPTLRIAEALASIGETSQPELERVIRSGRLPGHAFDARPVEERTMSWLAQAERLGAVRLAR